MNSSSAPPRSSRSGRRIPNASAGPAARRHRILLVLLGLVWVGLAVLTGVPARAGGAPSTVPGGTTGGDHPGPGATSPDAGSGISHPDRSVTARTSGSTGSLRFRWPIRPRPTVLRPFAPGPHRWSVGHRGVDLGTASGARIAAPATGVLSFAGTIAGRGVAVVTHTGGLRTTYEPVRPVVSVGTVVTPGRDFAVLDPRIRHCGSTPCLHWGAVHRDGGGRDTYLDPLALLGTPGPVVLLPLTGPEGPTGARAAPGP